LACWWFSLSCPAFWQAANPQANPFLLLNPVGYQLKNFNRQNQIAGRLPLEAQTPVIERIFH
jgi:hypothetical protein